MKKFKQIRHSILVIFMFFGVCTFGQQRPNIIIIIGDDISSTDLGCAGNKDINTPNINELAKNGIRFTNAFLTTSSCSPSRVSIITGRYPHNTGAAELHSPVPANQIAFPKFLKDAGYYTAQAGKWHFGSSASKPEGPFLNAFDRTGGSLLDGGGHSGASKWVEYVQQRPKDKPFFMWFAAHDAHREWDNEEKPVTYQADKLTVPLNLINNKETKEDFKAYYEELSRFDFYVGEVVKELKSQNIVNNTLIIIMADNGRPFPRNKTRLYDEGIKTPLIVHWPFVIKNGAVSSSLLSVIDIAPTLLEIAGIKSSKTFQGQSFKKLLTNPAENFRNYVFAEHNWHDFQAYERMVRTKSYMYIENGLPQLNNLGAIDIMGGGAGTQLRKAHQEGKLTPLQDLIFKQPQPRFEFYNCLKDKMQTNNLYANRNYKKEVNELKEVLSDWKKETDDSQPKNLTPDWYSRETNKPLTSKGKRGEMPGSDLKATANNKPGPF